MSKANDEKGEEIWDVLVVGTGVIESVIASGLSMRGYSVLVIDQSTAYGGLMNTVKLSAVHHWLSNSPSYSPLVFQTSSFSDKELDSDIYSSLSETDLDSFGKIHIDLIPKVLFSRGNLVNLIISCEISGYLDFQGIDDVFYAEKHNNSLNLIKTPYSKKDVFSSSDFELIEKRQIMRLFGGVKDILEMSDINKGTDLDLISDPFRTPAYIANQQSKSRMQKPELNSSLDFQTHWKISDKVMDLVKYGVAFDSCHQNDNYSWERDFLKYFHLLLGSLNQAFVLCYLQFTKCFHIQSLNPLNTW